MMSYICQSFGGVSRGLEFETEWESRACERLGNFFRVAQGVRIWRTIVHSRECVKDRLDCTGWREEGESRSTGRLAAQRYLECSPTNCIDIAEMRKPSASRAGPRMGPRETPLSGLSANPDYS